MNATVAALLFWCVGTCCGFSASVISSAERLDEPNEKVWLVPGAQATWSPGGPMWKDYTFFITSRPDYLKGSDRVLLSYSDSLDRDYQLSITLAVPARVFLFLDDRVPNVLTEMPWVHELGFADTGDDVVISEGGPLRAMSIYQVDLPAGDFAFLQQSSSAMMIGMYGIAAQSLVPEPSAGITAAVAGSLFAFQRRRRT